MSDWRKDLSTSWRKRYGAVVIGGIVLFFFLGCSLVSAQTKVQRTLFEDDMESGVNGWGVFSCTFPESDDCSLNPSWALTTAASRSGTHAWTDSPGGNYQNNVVSGLYTPRIDLTEVSSATLTFWHRFDIAKDDWAAVLISFGVDGEFHFLRYITGTNSTWRQMSLDLTPFVGQSIAIYFYLFADATTEPADGWYIDDVAVYSPSPNFDIVPDPNYCRDYGPCSAGQGDCDPGQCHEGLVCVNDVGAPYGLPAHYDVCEVPNADPDYCQDHGPCSAGLGDCDPGQCAKGLVCVNDVGAQYGLPAHFDMCEAKGFRPDPDYCVNKVCGIGEGDCDPGQCGAGLVCVNDVGAQYGLPAHYDVCEAGGRPDPDYCVNKVCGIGEGDCDPGQCASGLICANDVGAQYGLPAHYDVCEAEGSEQPDPDYCRDYGPCSAGQGDCDPGQCGAGLVCVNDVGAQYGLPAHYDVCEMPSGSTSGVRTGLEALKTGNVRAANNAFRQATIDDSADMTAGLYHAVARIATKAIDSPQLRALARRSGVSLSGDASDVCSLNLSLPGDFPPSAPRTAAILDALRDVLVPEIDAALTTLNGLPASVEVPFALGDLPPCLSMIVDGSVVEIDRGDVQTLTAILQAIQGASAALAAYDVDVGLQMLTTSTLQEILAAEPTILSLVSRARLSSARTFFDQALTRASQAIQSVLSETDSQADDLLVITPGDISDAERLKRTLDFVRQSLYGPVVLPTDIGLNDPERLNLSLFFSGRLGTLRSLVPDPDGIFPDPTFSGMALDLTQQDIEGYLPEKVLTWLRRE